MSVMTSKERVLTTLARGAADRVPINYSANPAIDNRLKRHFGLAPHDDEGLRRVLGVDFRWAGAPYRGPKLHADIPERQVMVDDWGIHRRWIEHGAGGYWDFCDFPLRDATEEQIANWPMPNPDDFDYRGVAAECRRLKRFAVCTGSAGLGDIINSSGMLRSMEQVLVDLITDDPAGLLLARRRCAIHLAIAERTLAAAKGAIDVLWMGEDLGTQIAPIISLELYRRHLRPLHQQFIDLAKSYNIPVIVHTCGSSSWVYPDFIEMGVAAVDTLQPEAANMAPAYLKRTFGDRLAFHGCISTAGPVATGTVTEAVADCAQTLEIMMPGGGYCFAPTNMLQDNSPTANVVAMYEVAKTCGVYPRPAKPPRPLLTVTSGLFDHMVLQRDARSRSAAQFAGSCTCAGELRATVTCRGKTLAGFRAAVVGKADGRTFRGELNGLPAGGPYTVALAVVDRQGRNTARLTMRDVLVGDV